MTTTLNLLFLLVLSWPFTKESLDGKVIEVVDGNTIRVICEGNEYYKIHLYGIDCPEPQQPFGTQAQKVLEQFVMGKTVRVVVEGKDRWGTRLGIVFPDKGQDPRLELVKEGLAWTSENLLLKELEDIKANAVSKKLGIWSEEKPVPPWIFRRQQTMMVPKSR